MYIRKEMSLACEVLPLLMMNVENGMSSLLTNIELIRYLKKKAEA